MDLKSLPPAIRPLGWPLTGCMECSLPFPLDKLFNTSDMDGGHLMTCAKCAQKMIDLLPKTKLTPVTEPEIKT